MAAYGGYQLRDYLVGRGTATILATGLATWGYASVTGINFSVFDASTGVEGRDQVQRAFTAVLSIFAIIAAALAAHGLVARDRRRGFDQLWFSRAVTPLRYYLQAFVLSGVGAVLLGAALAELYTIGVHPVSVLGAAACVALAWLAVGGLAFALSTVTKFHTAILTVLVVGDLALNRFAPMFRATTAGAVFVDVAQYLLPPAHIIAALSEPLVQGSLIDPRAIVWPALFGVACLTVAILQLRRRPLGT
jgi:ABC-type polysaccharide/polyol phosphate export permease